MRNTWRTPDNAVYYPYMLNLLDKPHLLIAGATGSGKSVLLNAILYSGLIKAPCDFQLVLIDPKQVELLDYKNLPHVLGYTDSVNGSIALLDHCIDLMTKRYTQIKRQGEKQYKGSSVYIVIDELADLLLSDESKEVKRRLQKIAQLGRAAGIHLILCSQSPSRKTIPAEITLNISDRIALHCLSAIESKQILGIKGAEDLERCGQFLYSSPDGYFRGYVPMVEKTELKSRIDYWLN